MTDYILEFYSKGDRKPYATHRVSHPDGWHPRNWQDFDGRMVPKAKIRYASNGAYVGETYRDVYGNKVIRWFREPKTGRRDRNGNWHPFGL